MDKNGRISMPEKGWYSLTIRKETALKVRELAKNKNVTVDEFINELMKPTSKGVWSRCTICRVKMKTENMEKHVKRAHPKSIRK
jgi:hypothetical protein